MHEKSQMSKHETYTGCVVGQQLEMHNNSH